MSVCICVQSRIANGISSILCIPVLNLKCQVVTVEAFTSNSHLWSPGNLVRIIGDCCEQKEAHRGAVGRHQSAISLMRYTYHAGNSVVSRCAWCYIILNGPSNSGVKLVSIHQCCTGCGKSMLCGASLIIRLVDIILWLSGCPTPWISLWMCSDWLSWCLELIGWTWASCFPDSFAKGDLSMSL